MSLFGRLFSYRPRPNRLPTEDFLTEAFAEFVGLLPRAIQFVFIRDLFVPAHLHAGWSVLDQAVPQFRAETQCRIDEGDRPDIVIFARTSPVIVVENKLSAPVRSSQQESNQLQGYGRWLRLAPIPLTAGPE